MQLTPSRSFLALFFVSGICGLLHESLWARYLGLLLGHAAYGQVLTLMVYMGGIGLGSHLASRLLPRLRDPLKAYVWTELGIAAGGFTFHPLFLLLRDGLLDSGLLAGRGTTMATILAVGTGLVATLPWALLLGMTFPLATSGLMRLQNDQGRDSIARLYFGNSLGAACGALLASYLFIPLLGTWGTLTTAGSLNLLVALGAIWTRRHLIPAPPAIRPVPVPAAPVPRRFVLLLLTLSLTTGLSSFLYEIGWIRFLALLIGSSSHAFDLMLSAFIFGLALGAWRIHRHPPQRPLRALLVAQLGMAAMAVLPLLFHEPLFRSSNLLNRILVRSVEAWPFHILSQFFYSALTMIPAAFFAGMTLPLLTVVLCRRMGEAATGKVYAWNTFGAIAGAGLGSLFLMPHLGLFRLLALGASIDLALALALLSSVRREALETESAPANSFTRQLLSFLSIRALPPLTLGLVVMAWILPPNDALLVAGAYRGPRTISATTRIHRLDGRTATISVHEVGNIVSVRTNGKPDASLDRTQPAQARMSDELTQNLAAWIARVYIHRPWEGALVGLGSGMTAHRLLGDPRLTHLDGIEIEEAMWKQSRFFRPFNRRIHEDPRYAMNLQDARIFFATRKRPYDVIVSEPSNPWVAGVSSLFTDEFYREVRSHLRPDGVFVQWLHTYEFEDELLLSIMTALHRHFPSLRLHFVPGTQDMVLVASRAPLQADGTAVRHPEDSLEMTRFRMQPRDIAQGTLLWTEATIAPLVKNRAPNSEFQPLVDAQAEKAFFAKHHANLVPRSYGGVLFPQDLIPAEHFDARRTTLLELRARLFADSTRVRPLAQWLSCRTPLSHLELSMVLGGWLPSCAPAWTWGLEGPWQEVARQLRTEIARSELSTPDALLFDFQYHLALGHRDSLEPARQRLLRNLPADAPASALRDLYLASLQAGDRRTAWKILHTYLPPRDTAMNALELRMLEKLSSVSPRTAL